METRIDRVKRASRRFRVLLSNEIHSADIKIGQARSGSTHFPLGEFLPGKSD